MQRWSPETYARNAPFVAVLGAAVVELLAPQPGERILDVGCGDGTLTQRIVAAGAHVVGIDASPEFVAAAEGRGIDARLVDAGAMRFDAEFDAAFSNAALHWMLDPDAVLAGVARALVRGGRFVAEMGGKHNVATIFEAIGAALGRRGIRVDPRHVWYYPSPAEYATRLEAAGFAVERIDYFARPTPLPTSMRAWLETFAQPLIARVDGAHHDELFEEIEARLAPRLRAADGTWSADYVRLRFVARAGTGVPSGLAPAPARG